MKEIFQPIFYRCSTHNKMCKEHQRRSEILSEDAGHRASKSQLPGFYISGTMVANDLNKTFPELQDKYCHRYKIYEFF